MISLFRSFRPVTLLLCVVVLTVLTDSGRAVPDTRWTSGIPVETDPNRDAKVKAFLQKKLHIESGDDIWLGAAETAALAGLYQREAVITNGEGQTTQVLLFFDSKETKAILGQYLDLNADPWGRDDTSVLHLDDRPTLGPPNARVTIVEFADFECPFCAHAFGELEALASTTYKGRIRVIFKNYPLNGHTWARTAAVAAECARVQNPSAFWRLARYFYSNQGKISAGNLQVNIDKAASESSLDIAALKACMAAPVAERRVIEDEIDGNELHVSSTPTFFIDGIPLVGVPEGKVFDFVITSELEAVRTHASR
jgi:protein-disulfide isomerase